MAAYFYKIRERETGRLYVGCQYSQTADPTKLLVSYKTSCRYIRERGVEAFVIERVLVRDDAREFERRYLRRMYARLGRDAFAQVYINRNLAPGIIFTPDVRARMSAGLKRAVIRRRAAGTLTPTFLGRCHSRETKETLSIKAIERIRIAGHPRGMKGKHHTDVTKEHLRNTSIASSAMRGRTGVDHPTGGTIWWNNGTLHKRSIECPGEGWCPGRIFKERTKRITKNGKKEN